MIRLKIKEVAQAKRISMGKLSRSADVSYTTIKNIFSDPFYSITTYTLGKIVDALGVSVHDVVEDVSRTEKPW